MCSFHIFTEFSLTLELSGLGVRRLRRRGEYIAGSFELTCNVLAASPSPFQRLVRHILLIELFLDFDSPCSFEGSVQVDDPT